MKIALIGYGKMGQEIEKIALERGHTIGLKIDSKNLDELTPANLSANDVAIEFTHPEAAEKNMLACFRSGVPVVCGTTGWLDKLAEVKHAMDESNGSLLYASNFSIGVNIFFELNRKLAALMAAQPGYNVSIEEIHHTAKKDRPSGTAISLAEQVMKDIPSKTSWVNHYSSNKEELSIISKRLNPAPGTHHVKYSSTIDDIEIIHTAHNRQGFAWGAVLAAEFIRDKKGLFSMKDVLDIE